MDSIIWAIKHTMRDIADTGLNCKFPLLIVKMDQLTISPSMPRGHQQLFHCIRPSSYQRILPTILPQYPPRYLLRAH